MQQFHDRGLGLWSVRMGGRLLTVFGALALVLAVVGVYGVKSYVVSQRTREIGIRMALGAPSSSVRWLVFREGVWLTAAGRACGGRPRRVLSTGPMRHPRRTLIALRTE